MKDKTPKMIEYKLKQRRGITDLKGLLGDLTAEYWTLEDWNKYYAKLPEYKEWNKQYVAKLKAEGTYGEEYGINISMVHNPMFDDKVVPGKESYRFVTLNLNNEGQEEE